MSKTKAVLEDAVQVGENFRVSIPLKISKALHLKKGDHLLVRLAGNKVELIPAELIPRDQLWFWTPEWQKMEREADEAIARGDIKSFNSVDELLRDLES